LEVEGMRKALKRSEQYLKAGRDALYVEALATTRSWRKLATPSGAPRW